MCPFLSAQDIWPDWGLNPGLLGYMPGALPLSYLAMGDPMWIALYDDRLHVQHRGCVEMKSDAVEHEQTVDQAGSRYHRAYVSIMT